MSFVNKDLEILQSKHEVRDLQFRGLQDIPALMRDTMWADLTFAWFGKLHAFLGILFSKLLGKKGIVVAGGDDVAKEPDIKYGMFSFWWKKCCPLFVFCYADLILSVSGFNRRETIENAKANPSKVKLLYHGFDDEKWKRLDGISKETLVLTVGQVTEETFRKKGLDLFVRSAAYLPDVPFILVGPWYDSAIDRLRAVASPNVTFTRGLYGEDLILMYSRAKVYVQASVHESFGCAVAEAMLCECVPVVSKRSALPEVVGDCGYYVDELSPAAVAAKIKEALSTPVEAGKKARERIKAVFPIQKRKNELMSAIEGLRY
jgi:glycosyltransferase involved in cell wall biosynthesis